MRGGEVRGREEVRGEGEGGEGEGEGGRGEVIHTSL